MGQKVNPNGIRLGIVKDWTSKWYASTKQFADYLHADLKVRKYLEKKLAAAGISRIHIERPASNARITIYAGRPGVIIGKKGSDIEVLRKNVSKIMGIPVHINIDEVRKPEIDGKLIAQNIAQQIERRVMYKRAMKRAVQSAMRAGALGIKISVGGRLGGAEIARTEWYREGRVPLHTFRADVDYATAVANTTYGVVGVKVWVFKGEIIGERAREITGDEKISEVETETEVK